jgi:hypothetical protein
MATTKQSHSKRLTARPAMAEPPQGRNGHRCCIIEDKIVVCPLVVADWPGS